MSITNTSKPGSANLTNTTRAAFEQTWDNNTTTWNSEVRTWDDMASLMDNISKPTTSITNTSKPA